MKLNGLVKMLLNYINLVRINLGYVDWFNWDWFFNDVSLGLLCHRLLLLVLKIGWRKRQDLRHDILVENLFVTIQRRDIRFKRDIIVRLDGWLWCRYI